MADDDGGALLFGLSLDECVGDFGGVVAVDFNHIPMPCAVFGCVVFGVYGVDHSGELHLVAVVEHDEVREAEETGNTSGTLRNLFLNTAIADESVGLVAYHSAETCFEETLGNSAANSHGMALAKRAGSILNATHGVELGVTGSHRTPLAELRQFFGSIFACEGKRGIEHGRHVARIKEETVAGKPCRIVGIGYEERRIKNIYEVGTTHSAAGMTGFGLFDHRGSENTDIVGCVIHEFRVHYIRYMYFML